MSIRVTTNGHRRELLTFAELEPAARDWFDYVDDEDAWTPRFVRAYGNVYDVHDAQVVTVHGDDGKPFTPFGVNVPTSSPLASWHAVQSEGGVWSGVLFRLLAGDDDGYVVVGHYYDDGEG